MNYKGLIVAATLLSGVSGAASAASVMFDSITDSATFTLSCMDCTLKAYDETDDDTNNGLAGTLTDPGDAFAPVNGNGVLNPELTGEQDEIDFMTDIAALFGDIYVPNSYAKDETGGTGGITVTAGDYVLWKTKDYAGVAKVLSVGPLNVFSFTGTHDLSHFAKIDTTPVPVPASLPLLLGSLGLTGWVLRRRRKTA